jgi:hypothetical protein
LTSRSAVPNRVLSHRRRPAHGWTYLGGRSSGRDFRKPVAEHQAWARRSLYRLRNGRHASCSAAKSTVSGPDNGGDRLRECRRCRLPASSPWMGQLMALNTNELLMLCALIFLAAGLLFFGWSCRSIGLPGRNGVVWVVSSNHEADGTGVEHPCRRFCNGAAATGASGRLEASCALRRNVNSPRLYRRCSKTAGSLVSNADWTGLGRCRLMPPNDGSPPSGLSEIKEKVHATVY